VRSSTISQNISLHHRDAAFDSPNTIILIEGRIRPCHAVSEQLEVGLEIDERHSVKCQASWELRSRLARKACGRRQQSGGEQAPTKYCDDGRQPVESYASLPALTWKGGVGMPFCDVAQACRVQRSSRAIRNHGSTIPQASTGTIPYQAQRASTWKNTQPRCNTAWSALPNTSVSVYEVAMSGRLTVSPSRGCQAVASASSSHDRARWSRRNTSALQHKAQLTLLAVLAAWYRTLCGGLDQHWLPHAETGLPKLVALQRAPLDSVPQENSQLAKRTKGHCSIAKQEIVCTGSPKVDRYTGLWIMQLMLLTKLSLLVVG